jgi:hypothetical protein
VTLHKRLGRLALLLALAGCTEQVTAPGVCPDYCPGGKIAVVDTIFTDIIGRDSSFTGYLEAHQGEVLHVADLPGIADSRAIFQMNAIPTRVRNDTGSDTTTVAITVDSARLRLNIVRRDTNATNLWVKLYRLPIGLDSTTTFAQLVPSFADSIVDSVNLSSLLTRPQIYDSATLAFWGDTIQTDSAGHVLQVGNIDSTLFLLIDLDTTQARFVEADSGKVAYGVRVSGDSLASIVLGATEAGRGAPMVWFFNFPDTSGTPKDSTVSRGSIFDSFVFDPPTPPLDSNLAVGGAPATRSLLRVTIPEVLRDSADVVRATLILVPVGPVPGAPGDSFTVVARPVITDLGAKSPLNPNPAFNGVKRIAMNTADTVRMELTDLIRAWALDTTAATALMLGQLPEASSFSQIRFYSTRTPAFRPALHITYVRRFAFGSP